MARDSAKQRNTEFRQRRNSSIAPKPHVLIICEGQATEVNYFTEIFQEFKVDKRTYKCIHAGYTQPRKVVDEAIKICEEKDSKWDYVFCVFDRDDHDGYDEAIVKAKNQVLKNTLGKAIDFKAIPSNPCFELWLLLHFKEHNREDGRVLIVRELKKHIPDYEKGKTKIFSQTKADWETAADRARRLQRRDDHSNPSTLVYELVEELHRLYP